MILIGHENGQEGLERLEGYGHEDLEIETFEANDRRNSGQLRLNWVEEVAFNYQHIVVLKSLFLNI